jgi:cupin superfamily acireductone dioxygenase involved in methionine salvage
MGEIMKIYNSVRYDKDFNVIEEDSFEYDGPLALAEGEEEGEGTPFTLGDTLPTEMMGDDGSFPKSLQDFTGVVIPGADKENEDHQQFHSKIGSLAKAYADTKRMVGGMIKIPGEDASKEEIAAYRSKIGVPATPADYTASIQETDGIKIDEDTLTKFKELAHEKGYTDEHLQLAIDFQKGMVMDQIKELDTMAEEGRKSLKLELGDKYEESMMGAEMVVQKYFSEDAQKYISATMGNNPEVVKGLIKMHNATKEDGDLLGETQDRKDASVKALESEINELMQSEKYAKGDKYTHEKVGDLITRKQKMLGTYQENAMAK